jgi:hypothetical protein
MVKGQVRKMSHASAHSAEIEPVSDRFVVECALDSLRLSHFLREPTFALKPEGRLGRKML